MNISDYPKFNFAAPLLPRSATHIWVRLIDGDRYLSCQQCGVLKTAAEPETCPGHARLDILNAPIDFEPAGLTTQTDPNSDLIPTGAW